MSNELLATTDVPSLLRRALLMLARQQDEIACEEASAVPYWAACPNSVLGHRDAAAALRANADRLLEGGLAGIFGRIA